jgi:hypothetical protein
MATGATTIPRILSAYQALSTLAVTTKVFTRRCQRRQDGRLLIGIDQRLASSIIENLASWLGRTAKLSKRTVSIAALTLKNRRPGHTPVSVPMPASPRGGVMRASMTKSGPALSVVQPSSLTDTLEKKPVPVHVVRVSNGSPARVYSLGVDSAHEYFANGILVHNCDCLRYILYTLEGAQEEQRQETLVTYDNPVVISRY